MVCAGIMEGFPNVNVLMLSKIVYIDEILYLNLNIYDANANVTVNLDCFFL